MSERDRGSGISERIARSAEHAANGDVESYLDELAGEAFAALYPAEVDLESLYERRAIGRASDHVVDAIVVATLEREADPSDDDPAATEPTTLGACDLCAEHGITQPAIAEASLGGGVWFSLCAAHAYRAQSGGFRVHYVARAVAIAPDAIEGGAVEGTVTL